MMFSLVVVGTPRTKKTSNRLAWRFSRRLGRKVRIVLPSAAWARWVKAAVIIELPLGTRWQPRGTLSGRVLLGLHPLTTEPVRCRALFYRDKNHGDAVGFYQGLADLLEKRGILANDRQIIDWSGSTLLKDAKHPRVEVELEVIE